MGSIAPEAEEVTVEVREASPAHYLLKIESFSLLSESGIEKFESSEFEAGGHKWKMVIYPDGNSHENGSGHISVYLAITGTSSLPAGWEVNAIFTFFVTIIFQCECLGSGKMRRFQPIKSLWGLPKFLSHNTFKEASNGYLVDDKCVLGAEIFIVQRQAIGDCLSMVKSDDSFKREWKISNISNLGEECWTSEEFTVGDYKWKLSLYPKGNANYKGCRISIFLHSVDSKYFYHHQKVKATFSFCLKDQILGGCYKRSDCTTWFLTTRQDLGYQGFMPLTKLHDQKKGYLVNDCIVVEVEMKVVFKHSVKSLY